MFFRPKQALVPSRGAPRAQPASHTVEGPQRRGEAKIIWNSRGDHRVLK